MSWNLYLIWRSLSFVRWTSQRNLCTLTAKHAGSTVQCNVKSCWSNVFLSFLSREHRVFIEHLKNLICVGNWVINNHEKKSWKSGLIWALTTTATAVTNISLGILGWFYFWCLLSSILCGVNIFQIDSSNNVLLEL